MAQPIRGYDGTITVSGITAGFINNWEITLETEEKEVGPFISDNQVYVYSTTRKLTGKLEATIPASKDTAQTTLISGALNGSYLALVLATTTGYTVTIPSGIVSSFNMAQDAAETVKISFDFRASGSYTIA